MFKVIAYQLIQFEMKHYTSTFYDAVSSLINLLSISIVYIVTYLILD